MKTMYNTAFRITGNEADASDAIQEAFISAFKNLKHYRGDSTFGVWLKRIVINKSINYLKKRTIETEEISDEVADYEEVEMETDVELSVERIMKCIEELPSGYRVVLSLYLLEGYDHEEIAGILNISQSTSKSQLNRSKKKLKELLEKSNGHEKGYQ